MFWLHVRRFFSYPKDFITSFLAGHKSAAIRVERCHLFITVFLFLYRSDPKSFSLNVSFIVSRLKFVMLQQLMFIFFFI